MTTYKTPQVLQAASLLSQHNIVVIPTETVYGLAANATDESAIEKIFTLKGRPSNNPLICHVATVEQLLQWIDPIEKGKYENVIKKLESFWPGPLSVVVPKHPAISNRATANGNSVGLRIPDHPLTLELLQLVEFPLAAPSANRSNYISPTKAEHVQNEFKDECPFILDGGECCTGIESTVLSLLDPNHPKILRLGAVTKEDLEHALGVTVEITHSTNNALHDKKMHLSPGQLSVHYAPQTKLQLLSKTDLSGHLPARIGLIAFSNDLAIDFDFASVRVLSERKDFDEIASGLYDALRELDTLHLDLILIDECAPIGVGAAIMDRVLRACARS